MRQLISFLEYAGPRCTRDTPRNRDIVQGWVDAWLPLADAAVDALTVILAEAPVPLDMSAVRARVIEDAQSDVTAFLNVPDATP